MAHITQHTFDFLRNIQENNNRDWFNERKKKFKGIFWCSLLTIIVYNAFQHAEEECVEDEDHQEEKPQIVTDGM